MSEQVAEQVAEQGGTVTGSQPLQASLTGTVKSAGRDKTIGVVFSFLAKHKKYGKLIRRRTTVHAHDEKNVARVGDQVELVSCRPISKTKSWRLKRVLREAPAAFVVDS
jgi:small subunit ribosomal protein S17